MKLTGLVELANNLSQSLNNHYADINDIDFMIEELNKKKKGIAHRMEKDALHLRSIMTDAAFVNGVNEQTLSDFNEALEGVDELVDVIKSNIKC